MADDDLALIDVGALVDGDDPGARLAVARRIDEACRELGFFRIVGHGVDPELHRRLATAARAFFALPDDDKSAVAMTRGGAAWRGWFDLGGELTSGRPDQKEGYYFGTELADDHPAVRAGRPLHGANLFPVAPASLRPAVLAWIEAMAGLGERLLEGVALGLGLDDGWFAQRVTAEPTMLFRIFRYPPAAELGERAGDEGVQEHTDYGLLTILAQDGTPGLQVRAPAGWIDVPADPDVFVVNLGDMLERMTSGRYRSTPHRVRNGAGTDRLSFPFFIDPSWDATCPPMPLDGGAGGAPSERWDGADPLAWDGTYGDYLTAKVAKVFPALFAAVRGDG